jgi:mono/diheme cytochrome c family protein
VEVTLRRSTKAALVVAMLIVVVGAFAFWRLVRRGFGTHEEPSAIETLAARSMRRWSAPADLRRAKNPLQLTGEVLGEARAHWADHCAVCHGNDGKGKTPIGERLYPRAPDMTLPATQELSDGEIFAIIENGVRLTGMPGWGDGTAQSAHESWALVHFVRRLPTLSAEEIGEMEAMNPKSPDEWRAIEEEQQFLSGGATPSPAHGESSHGH